MKRYRTISVLSLFVLISILAACNGKTAATSQPQTTPSQSPTPQRRPTTTLPTMQPFNATRIAGLAGFAQTATAMAQKAMEDCEGHPDLWGQDDLNYSPSGKWHTAYCQHPDSGANYTKVINPSDGLTWDVPYLDREGQNRPEGMDGGRMKIGAWTPNEKYAYFIRYFCCIDGPGLVFSNGMGLYRLNLSNGEITVIGEHGFPFSFSPDNKYMARYDENIDKVIIEDLEKEERIVYSLYEGFDLAGIFLWSPDGGKVIFSATDENWLESSPGFAIYLIDMHTSRLKFLIHQPSHNYYAYEWLSDFEVLLIDFLWPKHDLVLLNIKTGEVNPANLPTLTPTPSP